MPCLDPTIQARLGSWRVQVVLPRYSPLATYSRQTTRDTTSDLCSHTRDRTREIRRASCSMVAVWKVCISDTPHQLTVGSSLSLVGCTVCQVAQLPKLFYMLYVCWIRRVVWWHIGQVQCVKLHKNKNMLSECCVWKCVRCTPYMCRVHSHRNFIQTGHNFFWLVPWAFLWFIQIYLQSN